jgi:hypothetical protein
MKTDENLQKLKPRLGSSVQIFEKQRAENLASRPTPPSSQDTLNNSFNSYNGI